MSIDTEYKLQGFGANVGLGKSIAVILVDFSNAFTQPASRLHCDCDDALSHARLLIDCARRSRRPVIYTTVAYSGHDRRIAAKFISKAPSLADSTPESWLAQIDDRVAPTPDEPVITKLFASAFFGTTLDTCLRQEGCDSVMIAGASTSGCVRATAIDALQYGYSVAVVQDAVADRNNESHRASLADIKAKYADVMTTVEAIALLHGGVKQ